MNVDVELDAITKAIEQTNEIIDRYVTDKLESDKLLVTLLERLDQSQNMIDTFRTSINALKIRSKNLSSANLEIAARVFALEKNNATTQIRDCDN